MIQKRSCSLSTKVNRPFYDMIKIHVIIIQSFNIFNIYQEFNPCICETLFGNVITILPIIYQNKTKIPGKNKKCLVYL